MEEEKKMEAILKQERKIAKLKEEKRKKRNKKMNKTIDL